MRGRDMGCAENGLMAVRAGLLDRIEAIEAVLPALAPADIVNRVDEVRRLAREAGLEALSDMAHGVESVLARHGSVDAIAPCIAALRDAVGCETLDQRSVGAWLASLGLRLTH